ncbi:MAG TPA: HAD family phosphatase [Candidatus Binatia bacterium]|nr:HAD family phosphatase [Candidatus Binatia bacterium]
MRHRAVLFDLGGVVLGSPLHAIAAYERERGIAPGAVNRVVVESGPQGAWARLERGELRLEAFYPAFETDCAARAVRLSARALMERVAAAATPRPAMLAAIARLRAAGLGTGAITNNWITEDDTTAALRARFDVFVESRAVGLRKPDPRIYRLACTQLGIAPEAAVFLDDIGANLKPARLLGMATIKVTDPDAALDELGALVGLALR